MSTFGAEAQTSTAEDPTGGAPDIDVDANPEALHAHLQGQTDAFVDFVRRLAEAESPSTDPDAQHAVHRLLADKLAALDYRVMHLPGRTTGGCLYARPDGRDRGRPVQLLLGHGDTVWAHGTLQAMPVARDGDTLGGPGVFDMKAGLASIVFALQALDALGHRPPLAPVVLVTSDEEIGSHESRPHIERLARVAQRAFVLEPALGLDGAIKTARKGSGEFTLRVHADPSSGASRSLALSRLVQALHQMNDAERGVTVNVGTIGTDPHDPATGSLTVDVRVRTQDDAQRLDAAIRALTLDMPGVSLDLSGGIDRPPLERTPRNQRLWHAARRLGAALGLSLHEGRAGGASDGNFTSLHTATLDGLGAVGDGAHARHEHIDVPRTVDRCALLALLLLTPPRAAPEAA